MKYLTIGASVVLVIIAVIVTQNLVTSMRAIAEHDHHLQQDTLKSAIDDLRLQVTRIVSSTNEAALIAAADRIPARSGRLQPPQLEDSSTAKDTAAEDALAEEIRYIETAKSCYRSTLAIMAVDFPGPDSGISQADRDGFSSNFEELARASDEFLALAAVRPSAKALLAAKERQEELESILLEKLNAVHTTMTDTARREGEELAREFAMAKSLNIFAGLTAAVVLMVLSLFLRRRIGGMFSQISTQNEQIAAANAGLEAALTELRALQQELISKEKLSTLGRLTATVSHELRNPLAALRNSLFSLRKQIGTEESVTKLVDRADRNAVRCDTIIGELLEYTRDRHLDLQSLDLRSVAKEAAARVQLLPGVTHVFELPDTPVLATVDRASLQRVIVNLVENAGQAITAARRKGQVRITCGGQGSETAITIEDSGTGIPPELQPRIFEPLLTTKNFGAGLGLAIARNLVTQHGGTLTFETVPGKGTTFRIALPVAGEAADLLKAA